MRFDWWTFALQTVNFLVLAWLLQHFLYRPVMRVVAARKESSDRLLADAEASRRRAEELEAEVARHRAAMERERDGLLAEAHGAAQADAKATLDKARAEADRVMAEARERMRREKADALRDARHQAARLAAAMAARLAHAAPPSPESFLGRLGQGVASLSEANRAALRDGPLEIVTAAPPASDAAERLRRWVDEQLGTVAGGISFAVDASLLAGVELRAPHAVVRSSWAADLERLAAEVAHDDAAG